MDVIQDNYNQLLKQNEVLRQENEELKSLLHAHGIEYKPKLAEKKKTQCIHLLSYLQSNFPLKSVLPFSIPCSRAEKTFLHEDGSASPRQERLSTGLHQ